MSRIELYNGIKSALEGLGFDKEDGTTGTIQTVGLWRNQVEKFREEDPFLLPAVFIQFMPSNYMESSSKAYQLVDMTVRLHIIYETYFSDLDLLNLSQAVYSALQLKQWGYWGVLKRRNEEEEHDHDHLHSLIQDYDAGKGKDYGADARPTTPATINTIDLTIDKVDELS